jgi:hypothetical protein
MTKGDEGALAFMCFTAFLSLVLGGGILAGAGGVFIAIGVWSLTVAFGLAFLSQ